ncbi:hypothetical protein [Altererythrobacter sp. GH1-8]|uniref:hypothetical protein n=1 Tax=Altererythrobacter sp. GH1-8 TaxID=3349333 RepID=UPI00374D1191
MSQSVVLNGAAAGDVRISTDGTRIYQAGSDGVVRVYDTLTGELVNEWQVGGNLGAMDISPDGGLLIIFDTQQPFFYYVNLQAFGQVTTLEYSLGANEGLISDVAIFSNQTALVIRPAAGGGFGNLQSLDINLGTFASAGSAGPGAILSRVSNPEPFVEEVLVSEPGIGGFVYRLGIGEFFEISSGLLDPLAQAIGGNLLAFAMPGTGVAIRSIGGGTTSIDLASFNLGTVRDLEFSADLEFLYILGQSGSALFTVRTSDWSLVNSFATGALVPDSSTDPVTLLVDPRSQFFTIETGTSFVVVENPAAPDIVGTEFPDQIVGTLFADVISALGGDDDIDAGAGADIILAGSGFDRIEGGSNIDTIIANGNRADFTITQVAAGRFEITNGGTFLDATGVEFLQFTDQTIRLLPGTGISVNFNTADPSVYQTAMNGIRDFDGNALGGNGNWLRIGAADINGDGDIDQILVNDAIGRFTTVGTAPDGLVYFADHSWAGETRVAGIYIDPLVASGDVVAGSPNDSQVRFQNDLQIENINGVLGADDYDGDGIWEVYFALTDGTAYLRAFMHADGNIRYANYQSQQQMIDYLTANGYTESTWGSWLYGGSGQEPPASGKPGELNNPVADPESGGKQDAGSGSSSGGGSGSDGWMMPGDILAGELALASQSLLEQQLHAEFFG